MPAPNAPTPKTPQTKGKPMGIPIWGWGAAIAAGLIIAFVIAKKSGASTSADTGSASSNSNPLGNSTSDSGGGVVAPPPPDSTSGSSAVVGTLTDTGTVSRPSGDSSTSTTLISDPSSEFIGTFTGHGPMDTGDSSPPPVSSVPHLGQDVTQSSPNNTLSSSNVLPHGQVIS